MLWRLPICCLLILMAFALSFSETSAVTLSPPIVKHEAEPGEKATGQIYLASDLPQDEVFRITVQNFAPSGEDGQQTFIEEVSPTGLAEWLTPEEALITVKKDELVKVRYNLRVPAQAQPGGYYAAMFFQRLTENDLIKGASVGVASKIGALFLVRVKGEIIESAQIESFRVMPSSANRLPVNFETRVRNLGGSHILPTGTVTVYNLLGQIAAELPVNPQSGEALPNSVRRFGVAWQSGEAAKGGFWTELMNEWLNFGFGPYVARANVVYGENKQELNAEARLWVVPWRIILITTLMASVILAVAWGSCAWKAKGLRKK